MLLFEPDRTPYDLRWRMFGIDVRVHPMFWLVTTILGWDWYRAGETGAEGVGYVALWVLCVFVSILVHEMGHVVAMRASGSQARIVLFGFGGLAIPDSVPSARWRRIVISLAGPGAQFLLLGVIWLLVYRLELLGGPREHLVRLVERDPAFLAVLMLWWINLFWPILNLVPIWPLDGGHVSRELCEAAAPRNGRRYSLLLSMLTAGVLAAHILMSQRGPGLIPWLNEWFRASPLMALFFILFAVQSYQALQEESYRRRNWDDDNLPWERR